MVPPVPHPSSRLVRAVQAEQADLDRHRARLLRSRESLLAELDRIESGLAEVDERRALLRRLAPGGGEAGGAGGGEADSAGGADAARAGAGGAGEERRGGRGRGGGHEGRVTEAAGAGALRGPAVREAAVRALLEHPDRPEALHYREWYALLAARGLRVAGKDPVAVFLTQLSRSPVVRKGTRPGVYELDRAAPRRLRARIAEIHEQLRELASTPPGGADLAAIRARRSELTTRLGRLERALEEAARLLERERAAPAA